jgi:hypothetical protein
MMGHHLLALWHPDVLFVGGLLLAVIHKFDNILHQNRYNKIKIKIELHCRRK